MNRFNLTFSGEILAGHDPARVKLRFGKMFAIDDPVRLERFFCGQTIVLRRNLERKAAAQYYHELHLLGVVATLVKVTASDAADAVVNAPLSPPKKTPHDTTATPNQTASKREMPESRPGEVDQTWAVSARIATRSPQRKKARGGAQTVSQKMSTTPRRDKTEIAAKLKARKQTAPADHKRIAVEESAQQEAEKKRLEQEETARREALAAEARRQAAEEVAQREAERAQIKRRKAEDAARKQATKAETRRQAAAEAARQKALREQQKAELAQQKAEEAARVQAELEALQRREAEEAAKLQAELEEIKRQEAEEAARLQAELEQIKRQEAEEATRIKAEAQRREAEAQRQSAERRRAAAEQLAAQRVLRKEEKRKAALEQQEQAALTDALHKQTVQRAAAELAPSSVLKPTKARVRTSLEVPQRRPTATAEVVTPAPRKRQSGEPNLYKLRPFRNTDEVRARAAQANRRMRQGYTLAAIALAALLITGGSFLRQTTDPVIAGANAMAIDPQSAPLLLAGDRLLFHDRAGVSTKEIPLSALDVSQLQPPMAFDSTGALLALGRLSGDSGDAAGGNSLQLLRCELAPPRCKHFLPQLQDSSIDAFVIHPLDGSLLLTDSGAGELLKINRDGQIMARASIAIPEQPVLRLHGGLLLMNSADGPAISVFRYEDNAFGQQLDEILLLPPTAQKAEQSRVGDFLWSSNTWWASLHNPVSGSVGLYRFDDEWNYLDKVDLPVDAGPLQLISWGEKTLVNDPRRLAALRFNAQGAVEAPFVSSQLAELITERQRHASLTTLAWRGALLGCALTTALGFGFGYLQRLRTLVYKPRREHGAEPVDDYADTLHWVDPVMNRQNLLHRRGFNYGLLAIGILLLAIGQSVATWQLAALLVALSGPIIALLLLGRCPIGHIGILQNRLLLVDHSGMYHLAGGSSVQYCGPFLLIDDVVVFCGSSLLPAFNSSQIQKLVRPLALGGVKVDRNTVLVKLLQCRHPLTQGVFAIMATATAATILLCLHGIF